VKRRAVLALALALALASALTATNAQAATEYVSDELVLGVYSEQNQQGERLTTLHSGAAVETLSASGDFTQVRLADGTIGWVKSTFLTAREPATVRVKQLEEELDRSRATTPALAEAAAHSEVERLQRELADKQSELDASRLTPSEPRAAAAPPTEGAAKRINGLMALCAVLAALALGFWLGYASLAHRVKRKFGGLRVY
jgi:hypothetical protein